MNQPRSIYKTDYVPFDWMENNFSSENNDFCSPENIDECLRHISQELSALGYPSIYSSSSDCGYAVNCDIVRLLNVTFELIGNCRDHAQIKDDLECRNRRLSSDLTTLSRKNSQLKESLEQSENKYKSVLERERQLKEKNNRLLQTIKNEKEESKKLSSQMQQQKNAYQHEVRKYENTINQMKAKLNQIISDRNPDKKVASISPSYLLQRNSKQRGKWQTGSVAKSCVEEMYNSVISSYENRCQEMIKEISVYRSCFEHIQYQIIEVNSSIGGNMQDFIDLVPLKAIWNGTDLQKTLFDRFQYLLNELKGNALKMIADNSKKSENETTLLKLKLSSHQELTERSKLSEQMALSEETEMKDKELSGCFEKLSLDTMKEQLEVEKENLKKEKSELSATASFIEKEKADLALQKLKIIRLAMHQESPSSSQWHESLNTLSSFSVITTNDGSTVVPSAKELKQCLSSPDYQLQSLTPLWKVGSLVSPEQKKSKSDMTLDKLKSMLSSETSSTEDIAPEKKREYFKSSTPSSSNSASPEEKKSESEMTLEKLKSMLPSETSSTEDIGPENANLPKWALAAMVPSPYPLPSRDMTSIFETSIANSTSNEELDLSTVSSEQNLELLNAAMADIEKRRNQMSR